MQTSTGRSAALEEPGAMAEGAIPAVHLVNGHISVQ